MAMKERERECVCVIIFLLDQILSRSAYSIYKNTFDELNYEKIFEGEKIIKRCACL